MGTPDLNHPDFADFYDELPLWSAPFALKLLERVPLRRGQTIMDLGCGTGFLTVELAQRCGADSKVYAVDPWPAAMARLERKLAYHGIGNVELIVRGGAETGLADGIVDLTVSNLGVNNFAEPDAVLAEVFRVTRPGGRLMLTTNLKGHMAEVYECLREALEELGLADRVAALAAHEDSRGTIAEVSDRLVRAGFQDVTAETSSYTMRFADGSAMLRHWSMRLGFVPAWQAIAGDRAPHVMASLERRLNARAETRGELALTIPIALIAGRKS